MFNQGLEITLGLFLFYFIIPLVLFVLLRPLMLWFWKIKIIEKNLEEQKQLLKDQKDLLEQIYLLQKDKK